MIPSPLPTAPAPPTLDPAELDDGGGDDRDLNELESLVLKLLFKSDFPFDAYGVVVAEVIVDVIVFIAGFGATAGDLVVQAGATLGCCNEWSEAVEETIDEGEGVENLDDALVVAAEVVVVIAVESDLATACLKKSSNSVFTHPAAAAVAGGAEPSRDLI